MIISRTPFRISLGGGGTDLPAYYSHHGGFLVSAAINRYVYIMVNRRFEDSIRVSYSRTEIVDKAERIEHPIVREALKLLGLVRGLEVVSIADLPSNSGLGSSSSFTVGLLNALHAFKRETVSAQQLAEEAFHIEVDILGEPIGKQDQYIAAFGGITCLHIDKHGSVTVEPLHVPTEVVREFEHSVLLFYTGIQRRAAEVLAEQTNAMIGGDGHVSEALHVIKDIGFRVKESLETCSLDLFGELLHQHWQAKKQMSQKISSDHIDRWYDLARAHGATGGKIMGAGGGGFFMFYCDGGDKGSLRKALAEEGLREMPYAIDFEGSKIMVNL